MKRNGPLYIDDSNIKNGVITVKNLKASNKKTKVMVESRNHSVCYDIYSTPIVVPLQFSHGIYTVMLLENITGNKYRKIGSVRMIVKITNPLAPYLMPNVYVDYTDQSACVQKANELCNGQWTAEDKFIAVKCYINTHFKYRYLYALSSARKNDMPKIDEAFEKGFGICQDFAGIATAMLRSQGVPAKLVIGLANQNRHAWVQAFYKNKWHLYDPTKAIIKNDNEVVYKEQRWY